ncbi:hypothetical protein EVAR_78133_1 [Eumeta japonica]|uniref:Uncharacterized protein n=1 Tax=Eumeta variegata TaxID=151549 RepID=A0A4C1T367_EUMVA|nr:hypothetical protein EVAR_78133_1 [Eumeta japonica]
MAKHGQKRIQNLNILHRQGLRNKFTSENAGQKIPNDHNKTHLTMAMYKQRRLKWTETEVTPGWGDNKRKIEGVGIKLFTDLANEQYRKIKEPYFEIPYQHQARDELEKTPAD